MAALRVLTFNFHEPYLFLLAQTGHDFSIGQYTHKDYARAWKTNFRPVPENMRLVEEAEWRRVLETGGYDVVIAQNELNALDLARFTAPMILVCHNMRAFLETTVRPPSDGKASYDKLIARLKDKFHFVFISEAKRAGYGLPGTVIPPGIEARSLGGYRGEMPAVLRVGNVMTDRNLMFDVPLQEAACRGLPNRVVGEDPGIANAVPSRSYDELLELYRSHRCLLHVTKEGYEDGYNLATLEAMACGMPIVTLAHKTSPITHEKDGLVANTAEGLRAHLARLLEDQDLAARLGAEARKTVQREFPMSRFIERWNAVLHEVAEKGHPIASHASNPSTPSAALHEGPRLRIHLAMPLNSSDITRSIEEALRPRHDVIPMPAPEADQNQEDGNTLSLCLLDATCKVPDEWNDAPRPRVAYVYETIGNSDALKHAAAQFEAFFCSSQSNVAMLSQAGMRHIAWLPPAATSVALALDPDAPRDVDVVVHEHQITINDLITGLPDAVIAMAVKKDRAQTYAKAKIVLWTEAGDVAQEAFDAMAAGAMLLIRRGADLSAFGEEGVHFIAFDRTDEITPLAKRYLVDERVRTDIAKAGMARVRRLHTYDHRMRDLVGAMLEATGARGGLSGEGRFHFGGYYCAPRPELAAQVPLHAERVLDVGCGGGEFGRSLKERGAKEVVGIEVIERAWELARRNLDDALLGNIESMELPFEDGYFDCIVFGDVLEHLIDPTGVLKRLKRVLSPDGVMVMSIPNIQFYQTIDMLGRGRWKYEDAGIMDRTHLRFFTAVEINEMVQAAGLKLSRLQPLSMADKSHVQHKADKSVTIGRVTISNVTDAELVHFLTYQWLAVAMCDDVDLIEAAQRALDAGQNEKAYHLAESAPEQNSPARLRVMGKALARLGKLDTAERLYRQALESQPGDPLLSSELGLVLCACNRAKEAKPYIESAYEHQPNDARLSGAMGLVALSEGNLEVACEYFEESLKIDFANLAILRSLLNAARELHQPERALPHLERYTQFYPGQLDMVYEHATLLHELDRNTEAREVLDTLLMFNGEHEQAKALLAELSRE